MSRISAAYDSGHYELLDNMYAEANVQEFNYRQYSDGNVSMDTLMELGHRKEDMIVG